MQSRMSRPRSKMLLCLLAIVSASAFHVQYKSFTLPQMGQKLRGEQIQTEVGTSTFFCANRCMRLEECTAFNYHESKRTCHLMNNQDIADAETDPDYQLVLKKISCDKQPCLHGGICSDEPTTVQDILDIRCDCPCGRCGRRCEKLHVGHVENACIYLFNAGYQKVESPEECMSFCWDTQGCRSADYISSVGACWLNSVTGDEEPLTMDCDKWYPGVAYLFFNCTCDDPKK